jgi:hypothetical protein
VISPYDSVLAMIKTPDIHRLLQEARERARAEKEDRDILC